MGRFRRTEPVRSIGAMASYLREPVDELPFGSEDKARRYRTELYRGAVGRNWYECDPTLQFLMRRYLGADGLAWATPHLTALGALMGGPIAERAEETDRNPPRLERYDRWGHEVSQVVMPPSFEASRRDLIELGFGSDAFRERGPRRRRRPGPAERGVELPAQPGRDRDDVRPRHRWRHGRPARRGVRSRRRQAAGPRAVRRGRDVRRGGADAHRAHRRLRPRRAGDHGHARRRRLAAQRVQVVRVQRQRIGVRRARQARGRARRHPRHRHVPRALGAP